MTGSVVVEADPSIWLTPPSEAGADVDGWALQTAVECFSDAGLSPDERQTTLLSTALLALARYAQDAGGLSFIHLRQPEGGPRALAVLRAQDAGDGSPFSLRELIGADTDDLAEPAAVETLDTALGPALRARRYLLSREPGDPPGTLLAALSYVWHVPQHDTDFVLMSASFDLADLHQVEPDLDDLARAVRVEP